MSTTPSPCRSTGLSPATTYWYRFDADGERSPSGGPAPSPTDDATAFRIATVCCADYAVAPLGVYRAVAEREVDLVLHLGDYIYEKEGSRGGRRHDPPHVATTLDDYRRRIAQVRSDPDAQALHLRHPMITIWDDHDLADNAWRDGAKAHDPAEHGAVGRPGGGRRACPTGVAARPAAAPARSAHHVAVGRHRRPG